MKKFFTVICVSITLALALFCAGCATWANLSAVPDVEIDLRLDDRILVLAPHPDDEVLGCGGLIQKCIKAGLPVRTVFLTNGDNNELSFLLYRKRPALVPKAVIAMGRVRHDEAVKACAALGLNDEHLVFLGYPDFGTLNIWKRHWRDAVAFRSMLTRVRGVEYDNAFRPGAPYKGEDILDDLKAILLDFRPTKIFVSHPSDFNPDHRALYLFARVALWDLSEDLSCELYPYLIHYPGWPAPRAFKPDRALKPPSFFDNAVEWRKLSLSEAMIETKLSALNEHKTQMTYGQKYMLSFLRTNELFGDFADVNLMGATGRKGVAVDDDDGYAGFDDDDAGGIERRTFRIEEDNLVISLRFSGRRSKYFSSEIYCFGYRPDRDFADMPKIRITNNFSGSYAYDLNEILPVGSVITKVNRNEFEVEIPLSLLGNPEKALTGGRAYFEGARSDWVSWRILDFGKQLHDEKLLIHDVEPPVL